MIEKENFKVKTKENCDTINEALGVSEERRIELYNMIRNIFLVKKASIGSMVDDMNQILSKCKSYEESLLSMFWLGNMVAKLYSRGTLIGL